MQLHTALQPSNLAAATAAPLALLPRRFLLMEGKPSCQNGRCGLLAGAVVRAPTPSSSRALSRGVRCESVPVPVPVPVPATAPSEVRDDAFYMRRCVELARRAVGCTSPNPMVGCVIVKGGEVLGEGFHPKAGQPHAEVFALRNAGDLAENATAYVSLEPCNHHGRTPPCTEALIHAKVKHVVVGMLDPNPIVASKGVERLRESGIDVIVGVEEALCRKLNEAYIHRMLTGRPFVTLRYTLAINGGIVNHMGKGARELGGYYSVLLQEYDGVVISGHSLIQNSALPASQEMGANQPVIIIIAGRSNTPLCLPALAMKDSIRAIIFVEKDTVFDTETDKNLNKLGIERVILDKIRLTPIVEYCTHRGLCSLLLDLTDNLVDFSGIFEEVMEEELLQKVITEICPEWTDKSTASSILETGAKSLKLRDLQSGVSKGSIVVEGYIAQSTWKESG